MIRSLYKVSLNMCTLLNKSVIEALLCFITGNEAFQTTFGGGRNDGEVSTTGE